MTISLKGQTGGIQILGEREVGKFRPKAWDLRREQRQISEEEERQKLRRLAMTQATLTKYREPLAKKMYRNEPIAIADWPALELLTPQERTRLIADVRQVFGLRPACDCPERAQGRHRLGCAQGRP